MLCQINKHKRTAGTGALRAPVVAVFLDLLILYNVFQVLSNYYTQTMPLGCFGLNNLGFCQQPRLILQSVYIYIYIFIEREKDRQKGKGFMFSCFEYTQHATAVYDLDIPP